MYFSALAVPQTTLLATDRLAVRFYVLHSGRTIKMHTENSHLSQIITTFSTGLTALNGLTSQTQNFAVGTSGSDFNISSVTDTHTFNLPNASATARGVITTGSQTLAGTKTFSDIITSKLTINSTTQGMLPPRMTTAQKNAISSPATGLIVYDTDLNSIANYNGTSWISVTSNAPSQQVYTGTITWTGVTAPSGATTHTYNWSRTNNLVTLKITLVYATTGAALTAVLVTLPTDCPTPLKPTGLTAASNNLYTGSGLFSNSLTGTPSASNRVFLRSNSANNGFEINSNGPAAGYLFADIIVQYFTS